MGNFFEDLWEDANDGITDISDSLGVRSIVDDVFDYLSPRLTDLFAFEGRWPQEWGGQWIDDQFSGGKVENSQVSVTQLFNSEILGLEDQANFLAGILNQVEVAEILKEQFIGQTATNFNHYLYHAKNYPNGLTNFTYSSSVQALKDPFFGYNAEAFLSGTAQEASESSFIDGLQPDMGELREVASVDYYSPKLNHEIESLILNSAFGLPNGCTIRVLGSIRREFSVPEYVWAYLLNIRGLNPYIKPNGKYNRVCSNPISPSHNEFLRWVFIYPDGGTTPSGIAIMYRSASNTVEIEEIDLRTQQIGSMVHIQIYNPDGSHYTNQVEHWYLNHNEEVTPLNVKEGFPVIPIRLNGQNMGDVSQENTDLYLASEKLLNSIGFNYSEFCEEVHTQAGSNLGDIPSIFLKSGIPVTSTDTVSKEYIYQYFMHTFLFAGMSNTTQQITEVHNASEQEDTVITPTYSVNDNLTTYNNKIIYSDINITTEELVLADGIKDRVTVSQANDILSVTKDISKNTRVTIQVVGLTYNTEINGVWDSVTLGAAFGIEEKAMLLPLSNVILNDMGITAAKVLLPASLHLQFHAYSKQNLAWVYGGDFKIVMLVIAVIAIIISLGSATAAVGSAYSAAIAAGASTTVAVAAAIGTLVAIIAIGVAASYAGRWLVGKLGEDTSLGLVIILATAAVIIGATTDNPDLLVTAEALLLASSTLTTGIEYNVQEDMKALEDSAIDFKEEAYSKSKELNSIVEEFNIEHFLKPMLLTEALLHMRPEEEPDDFYSRTVHTGNPGVLVFDALHNYVDTALMLPTNTNIMGI